MRATFECQEKWGSPDTHRDRLTPIRTGYNMPRCFSDNTLWCLVATTPRIRTRRGPPRTFRAFSDANYRLLWPANFLSFMSRWMQMFTLGWFVLVRTDSPWLVVMVGFSGTAPMLLLGLFGGYLADSFPRQRLIVLTQLACLVAAVAMTVLLANDGAVYWHAYLMALVIGGAWALDMPARRSAIHDLLGSTGVTNGLALDTVGMSASRMLGPALAGVLISTMGFAGAYAVATAFYVVEVVLLMRFRVPGVDRGAGPSNLLSNLLVGVRYVKSNRTLRAAVMVTITMNVLLFPYMHLIPVVAREVLNTAAYTSRARYFRSWPCSCSLCPAGMRCRCPL